MKKCRNILLVCVMIATVAVAILLWPENPAPTISHSMYSDATGLHYQEWNGYQAAVVERDFISAPRVLEWLDTLPAAAEGQGYYEFIYSDPDSWDMYIFWPAAGMAKNAAPAQGSMYFSISDSTVHLYFDSTSDAEPADVLLVVQAPMREAWPTGSAVHIGDQTIQKYSLGSGYTAHKIDVLLDDLGISESERDLYRGAIAGSGHDQAQLRSQAQRLKIYPHAIYKIANQDGSTTYVPPEEECHYNIANMYYHGWNDTLSADKEKALAWLLSSAEKGYAPAAMQAADMLMDGDGVAADQAQAFSLYETACESMPSGIALRRLGDCYLTGQGTAANREKAFEMLMNGAFCGDAESLARLAEHFEIPNEQLLYKALASLGFRYDYWDIAYGEPDTYVMESVRQRAVSHLSSAWDAGTDPLAMDMKQSTMSNPWFSPGFLTQMKKIMYTYAYYGFASQYACTANAQQGSVEFNFEEDKEEDWDRWWFNPNGAGFGIGGGYYIYDLDGDGVEELYAPFHTGAGGAHSGNPIIVLERDAQGRFDLSAVMSQYSHRDALYLISYDGAYYFVVNPYSDSGNALFNLDVVRYGSDGTFRMARLECSDYRPQRVLSLSNEEYIRANGLGSLIAIARTQAEEAISCSRQNLLYSPEEERGLLSEYRSHDSLDPSPESKDIYIRCNYDNDDVWETIVKGHRIDSSGKYYFDLTRVDVFESKEEAATATPIAMMDLNFGYYGRVSLGNIYDILPLDHSLLQFWIINYKDNYYTAALTRHDMTYTLSLYYLEGAQVTTLHQELFLDAFGAIHVTFP